MIRTPFRSYDQAINDIRSVTEVIRANPNKTATSTMINPHAITHDISYLTQDISYLTLAWWDFGI